MVKVCIVCHKENVRGYPVQDDAVIRAIRKIKQRFNMAKNNELVVEDACLAEYKKKREKFEKSLAQHVILGGILLIVVVFAPLLSGSFSIVPFIFSVIMGVLAALIVSGLSLVNYSPKIENSEAIVGAMQKQSAVPAATVPAAAVPAKTPKPVKKEERPKSTKKK